MPNLVGNHYNKISPRVCDGSGMFGGGTRLCMTTSSHNQGAAAEVNAIREQQLKQTQ